MSLIKAAGAGEQSTGFYKHLLDQSLRFDSSDAQYLSRTPASATNQRTFTLSMWVKRTALGSQNFLFSTGADSNNRVQIGFENADNINIECKSGGSTQIQYITSRLFRDVSAWYHLVFAFDTTNGTAGNRIRVYVNGSEETSFGTETNPSQNADLQVNKAAEHFIGKRSYSTNYFNGYMAEINFIDGTQLTPASFGETIEGIWTAKDTSGLTFGTNGFHLTFKDDVVSEGFNTVTYTGNGGTQSISGLGFSPALIWIKSRSQARGHVLEDVVRGAGKYLQSNTTSAEGTSSTTTQSFDADGFTQSSNAATNNGSGETYVGWCWEAGGTPTATNSAGAGATPTSNSVKIDGSNLGSALAGTIPATKISANTARGFSIVGYEATGTAGTIAHGLSAAPELIIVKHRDQSGTSWPVYYGDNTDAMYLNDSGATSDDANAWNDTTPTSTVFSVGANGGDTNNSSGGSTIAYCFHSVSGYSKIGTFTGNGGSQAIDVGFEPAFVMLRRTNGSTWGIFDNLRGNSGSDRNLQMLAANSTAVETTNSQMTFSGNTFNDNGYLSDNGTTVLYMAFADTREAAFFKDVTTNGNHFVPVNLDYRNSVPDTPTNNFCTFNPISDDNQVANTYSEGNLGVTPPGSGGFESAVATFTLPRTGKWYWEYRTGAGGSSIYGRPSIITVDEFYTQTDDRDEITGGSAASNPNGVLFTANDGGKRINNSDTSFGSAVSAGDIIGNAYDADTGQWFIYINNSIQASGAAISESIKANFAGKDVFIMHERYNGNGLDMYNFGQDSSFAGFVVTANANADGNGHGSFAYAPPSGYLALCSQNLPDVEIIDGTDNFNTVLYTGDGASSKSITGVGFSPDWVWAKNRASTYDHALMDSVRGASAAYLSTNNTASESTYGNSYGSLSFFDSDGFTVAEGTDGTYPDAAFNQSSEAYVAWNWLAGTAFSNDASATSVGTIDSSGQVNAKAGFSIVSWTGTGSAGTIAHGISKPELIIVKNRDQADKWVVYHEGQNANPATGYVSLNETSAFGASSSVWNDTAPTSTVFSVGTGGSVNASSEKYISYIFHSVEGYSKVGSYTGNASADGTFVYTGFRPAWVLLKSSSSSGDDWFIFDNKRQTYNVIGNYLRASQSTAEQVYTLLDFVSNGFKFRASSGAVNDATTFIYLAFAEQPFKFANAR